MQVSRFAPSTTGRAHPGTLLAALLAWLDARSQGARLLLRLEDLDPERSRPEWSLSMRDDLAWLGLDFDAVEAQHHSAARHDAALDALAALGLLYPCACSRSLLRAENDAAQARFLRARRERSEPRNELGRGARYPNQCRGRALPVGGWRACKEPLRVALPGGRIAPLDEGGRDLAQDPAAEMGDPIVRRRDGAVAYQLAVVVDDAASGVTRVVRGHDLAASTATQIALQRLLGLPEPAYRHHLLLLEERGGKLAKFHQAVGADALRGVYESRELTGFLAHAAGLRPDAAPTTPVSLLRDFSWERVACEDRVVLWDGSKLWLGRGSP